MSVADRLVRDAAVSPGETPVPDPVERLARARATFADAVVSDAPVASLGSVVLRPDQIETVRRVQEHLRRDGGCLLADDVGSGKTYVALAVARESTHALVVAPASLRPTWEQAARRADVRLNLASHEALSRGRLPQGPFDVVVVDESHRFRATSRRHDSLARLASRARLLLLSATPMQNHERELAAQLALFLGEVAFKIGPEALARWVVRSSAPADVRLPVVAPPRWLALDTDDGAVLRAILALPPPPRAADAGDGGVLLQLSLVRAWASSRAALAATICRRQRTLVAIEQCHAEGRLPTRRELQSWSGGDGVQLGFPTLLTTTSIERERADQLAAAIHAERTALDGLRSTLDGGDDPDVARVMALRALRASHAGESILAFSEWGSTVRGYWSALRADAGVGLLTANDARIASGRIARDALLARFAPRAQGASPPAAHERVTLLLATDLLSEGVNLQDASVVVHLDLPWNPARLAQRVGRVRRPGGRRQVASYLMSPPAHASLLLRVEARLRAKLTRAERTIGRSITVLPALAPAGGDGQANTAHASGLAEHSSALSAAELRGEITRRLASWRRTKHDDRRARDEGAVIGAARANTCGWIALVDDGRLVALIDGGDFTARPSEGSLEVVEALAAADGAPRSPSPGECERALAMLSEWLMRDWSHRSCGLDVTDSPLRRRVLRAVDAEVGDAPRHRRTTILLHAARVRSALALPLPLGVERSLDALMNQRARGHDWIEEAAALVSNAPARPRGSSKPATVRALILFRRDQVNAAREGGAS